MTVSEPELVPYRCYCFACSKEQRARYINLRAKLMLCTVCGSGRIRNLHYPHDSEPIVDSPKE